MEEDLDHIFWQCEYASSDWELFFQTFGFSLAHQNVFRSMIEEFLLNSLGGRRVVFYGMLRYVPYGVEVGPCEIWSLVHYHVFF